jgi:energy-coupling factor transport system permease protein
MSRPPLSATTGRWTHPLAWWLWALGLISAAVRTTNPLLLGLLGLAVCYVVAARRTTAVTSRIYRIACWAAIATIAVCLAVQVAASDEGTSKAGLLAAFAFGGRIAVVLLCVGAAGALISPLRLFGVSAGVLTRLPAALTQVRQARRLRAVRRWHRPFLLPTALAEARARAQIAVSTRETCGYGKGREVAPMPRRWRLPECIVLAAGAGTAVCFALASAAALTPDPWSAHAPTVPVLAALGVLFAVLPAHLTPAPPAVRSLPNSLRVKAAA